MFIIYFIQNRMDDVTFQKLLNVNFYMWEDKHSISSKLLFEVKFSIPADLSIFIGHLYLHLLFFRYLEFSEKFIVFNLPKSSFTSSVKLYVFVGSIGLWISWSCFDCRSCRLYLALSSFKSSFCKNFVIFWSIAIE